MPILIAFMLALAAMPSAAATPPPILFVAREPLVAGHEVDYRRIEEETARLSAALGCPHPYLAMESLSGPKEIWWFNGFESSDEMKRVGNAYANNAPLAAALEKNRTRKAPFTGKVSEFTARYRADLSHGVPWLFGGDRFLVIAISKNRPFGVGTNYATDDGVFFVFSPAETRKQADHLAASSPGSVVVETRPSLSFPAMDWIAADPQFWRAGSP